MFPYQGLHNRRLFLSFFLRKLHLRSMRNPSILLPTETLSLTKYFQSMYIFSTKRYLLEQRYHTHTIFKVHFFVFKEVFSENSVLLYGQYSRAGYDGTHTIALEGGNIWLEPGKWSHSAYRLSVKNTHTRSSMDFT